MPTMQIAMTKPKPVPIPDDLSVIVGDLVKAEAGYLEEWRPEERAKAALKWRNLYFQAFRTMRPGQVHDTGYYTAARREDRLVITVRARAERRAS